jgi:hypothetical protein
MRFFVLALVLAGVACNGGGSDDTFYCPPSESQCAGDDDSGMDASQPDVHVNEATDAAIDGRDAAGDVGDANDAADANDAGGE